MPQKGGRQNVLATQLSSRMGENISSVFGSKFLSSLEPLVVKVEENGVRCEGLVSRPREGVGRADGDRQYIFCNRRPVDLPRINRLFNEVGCNCDHCIVNICEVVLPDMAPV